MRRQKLKAILAALLAAVFYAVNMPFSKLLLDEVPEALLAGLLYLGAGLGMGLLFLVRRRAASGEDIRSGDRLSRPDLPYAAGMVVLDILAPVSLMYGLARTSSANASLLNNFEIVATTVIALVVFGERVSARLWAGIAFVTASSILLSFEDLSLLHFSRGSFFVLLATVFWGFENNCTRKLADKDTYEIVMVKGLGSGAGAVLIGLIAGERLPGLFSLLAALLLGFVAYGLSIFFYIRAQKDLGAAKTSAYYAIAPFAGSLFSFLLLREALTGRYLVALALMAAGAGLATLDTLLLRHRHTHVHVIRHSHDGSTHTHRIEHSHAHRHLLEENRHSHAHRQEHKEKDSQ